MQLKSLWVEVEGGYGREGGRIWTVEGFPSWLRLLRSYCCCRRSKCLGDDLGEKINSSQTRVVHCTWNVANKAGEKHMCHCVRSIHKRGTVPGLQGLLTRLGPGGRPATDRGIEGAKTSKVAPIPNARNPRQSFEAF